MDDGVERIQDDPALRAVRAQARRILLQSLAWTALVMAIALSAP